MELSEMQSRVRIHGTGVALKTYRIDLTEKELEVLSLALQFLNPHDEAGIADFAEFDGELNEIEQLRIDMLDTIRDL